MNLLKYCFYKTRVAQCQEAHCGGHARWLEPRPGQPSHPSLLSRYIGVREVWEVEALTWYIGCSCKSLYRAHTHSTPPRFFDEVDCVAHPRAHLINANHLVLRFYPLCIFLLFYPLCIFLLSILLLLMTYCIICIFYFFLSIISMSIPC